MRNPVFVIVDDDDESRATTLQLCRNVFPACTFKTYEALAETRQTGRIDLLLVDTSAMSNGHWSFMASGLARFMEEYPSTEIFIMSGMSTNALYDLVEDLKEEYHIDTSNLHVAGFQWDSIRDAIKNKSTALSGPIKSGMIV